METFSPKSHDNSKIVKKWDLQRTMIASILEEKEKEKEREGGEEEKDFSERISSCTKFSNFKDDTVLSTGTENILKE